jgi:hypothetical protein
MKTLKSILPLVLLLAVIAALFLTRGVHPSFAAPVSAQGAWPAVYTLPPPCDYELDETCVTVADIPVAYVEGATCAADDPAWGSAQVANFYVRQAWESYLYPQHVESGPPNLEGESALRRPMMVAAIHNGTDICFRLVWSDATQDLAVDDLTRYADAVAIMIPFSGQDIAGIDYQDNVCPDSFHMGGFPGLVGGGSFPPFDGTGLPTLLPDCVQHIVQWRADQAPPDHMVRNLTAVGFSTSLVTSDSDTLPAWTWSNWDGANWDVIYKRPLVADSPNLSALVPGHSYPIAFATWDGALNERDGAKYVTEDYDNNLIIAPVP